LATYESNPHHRRSPRLQLTEQGVATLAALQREAARRAPDVEQDMELEDLETTLYVLRALRDAL
jgi:DNA-binding MarR family transcriptional regulator